MSLLKIEALSKKYGRVPILRNIGFSLEKGEVLSIIGSSGSGKTTLLRCINFLELADSGKISVGSELIYDGEDKRFRTETQIRKNRLHFGLVFQSFNLFPQYNAIENVMLAPKLLKAGKEKDIEEFAASLLEKVGLSGKEKNHPCQLSGGQQQRVAIARALALSPDILCFDEPTSALDPELTGEVLEVIRDLKSKDRTMIIVTHEMNFARNISDKVIFMSDGQIEEEGQPDEIFVRPKSEKTAHFLQIISEK